LPEITLNFEDKLKSMYSNDYPMTFKSDFKNNFAAIENEYTKNII
jgi:hypothetical protein